MQDRRTRITEQLGLAAGAVALWTAFIVLVLVA